MDTGGFPGGIRRFVLGFLALAGAVPLANAAAYSVSGSVTGYASPSGPPTQRSTTLNDAAVRASDDLTVYGATGSGNLAHATFKADLQTGELGAYSLAANAFDAGYGAWLGARATTDASFSDTLSFTIPAGTYASGMVATLSGRMTGQIVVPAVLPADVNANVGFSSWGAEFQRLLGGTNTFDSINGSSGFIFASLTPQTYNLDQPFTLQINILDAGSVLMQPQVVDARVAAYIGRAAANVAEVNSNESASVTADFSDSLHLLSVGVPDGVTWSSASHAFLAPVPEPTSALLLLAGVPLVLWMRRRARLVPVVRS